MNNKRRFTDTLPNEARSTYQQCEVKGNCRIVRIDSLAYCYMLASGFVELDREGECVLMRAPAGFFVAQERDGAMA